MRCRCNPVPVPFEFQISESPLRKKFLKGLPELFPIEHDLCELKQKIIQEYLQIIDKLECGIQEDLEFLLEEISLIDIMENEQ